MDITDVLEIAEKIGLLLGGGSLGSLFTLKYSRRQAQGEARSAENEATKAVQDIYQEMIEDFHKDREEQKEYIAEIKEDRSHLRKDRDELRLENARLKNSVKLLQEEIQGVKREQARQGRKLEIITPFICGRTECADRLKATLKELLANKDKEKNNKTE